MRSAAAVALDHLAYARRVSVAARESGRTATREVAVALLPELPSIAEAMAAYIETAMPEITDPDVLELIRAACQANCSALSMGCSAGCRSTRWHRPRRSFRPRARWCAMA